MVTISFSPSSDTLNRIKAARRAALAGMIAPILFAVVVVVLTIVQYRFLRGLGWNPVQDSDVPWPSALALGPYGWLQVGNFVLSGLLLMAFAVGLNMGITGAWWVRIGPMLLVVAGVALVLCGFPTDPPLALGSQPLGPQPLGSLPLGPQSWHGWVHAVSFLVLVVVVELSLFALWWTLRQDQRWHGYDWYSLVTGLLALAAFLVPGTGVYLALALVLVWIEAMAARLWVIAGRFVPVRSYAG